jgi:hypothetical protein
MAEIAAELNIGWGGSSIFSPIVLQRVIGLPCHFQDILLYLTGLLTSESIAQGLGLIFTWVVLDWEPISKHPKAPTGESCNTELECACSGQDVAQDAIAWLCVVKLGHI